MHKKLLDKEVLKMSLKDRLKYDYSFVKNWCHTSIAIKLAVKLYELKEFDNYTLFELMDFAVTYLKNKNTKYSHCHLSMTERRVRYLLELHTRQDAKAIQEVKLNIQSMIVSTAESSNNFAHILKVASESMRERMDMKGSCSLEELKVLILGLSKNVEVLRSLPQLNLIAPREERRLPSGEKVVSDADSKARYREIVTFLKNKDAK